MISLARLTLDRHAAGVMLPAELDAIPPYQWRIYLTELAPLCPQQKYPADNAKNPSALHIDAMEPHARCTEKSPDGRGLIWWLSGGSLMAYGPCDSDCPRVNEARGEGK